MLSWFLAGFALGLICLIFGGIFRAIGALIIVGFIVLALRAACGG